MTGTALAQYEDEPLPDWYAGPFVGYLFADPDRGADDALNLHLVGGYVLYDAVAIEANLFANSLDPALAGGPKTDLLGGGVDLALGVTAQGYPVFLLGAGMVQQDIGGASKSQPFLNLGLGLYLPFSFGRELWRLEGRYHVTSGEHPALPQEDVLDDFRLNLGVLFTFGGEEAPPAPAESQPPPPESVPPAPAPANVDTDADDDGVDDAADQCPGTAPNVAVGPDGCEMKAAAGPTPPPPPAPVDTDADDDGVDDANDRCPGTAPGTTVGPNGCVVVEDITMRSAYFGSDSASLTARAYELLRDVAAAMQADPAMRLEIEGHSDTSGAAPRNVPLSQQRADVVRDFLVSIGIAPGRLVAKGYGANRPVNDNSTLELRAANRRVQFRRLDGTP